MQIIEYVPKTLVLTLPVIKRYNYLYMYTNRLF